MKLYTASETRKIDNLAIKEKEISGYSLMQMAAEFSLDVILREFSPVEELIIFCSKGKNSGDGFLLLTADTRPWRSTLALKCLPRRPQQLRFSKKGISF